MDNQWIVPYSPFLCRLFDCHINIECVTSLGTFRYVFKYSNSTLLFGYFQLKLNFNHNQTQIIILSLKPSPSLLPQLCTPCTQPSCCSLCYVSSLVMHLCMLQSCWLLVRQCPKPCLYSVSLILSVCLPLARASELWLPISY